MPPPGGPDEDLKMKDIMSHIVVCCVIDFKRAEKPSSKLLLFNDIFSAIGIMSWTRVRMGVGFLKKDDKIGMDYEYSPSSAIE